MSTINPNELPLDESEFEFETSRSGGPGGQNVNKVESKVTLRWAVDVSPSLPDDVRERFMTKFANRINKEGELVVAANVHRDQPKNKAETVRKVREMVAQVWLPPVERKETKPTEGALARRRRDRDHDKKKKAMRRERPSWD